MDKTEINNYLSELYYNPKKPASFGGPSKLHQAVKDRYSLKQVRDLLQGISVYTFSGSYCLLCYIVCMSTRSMVELFAVFQCFVV